MKRYYAGVGSRETPPHVLELMENIAKELEKNNFYASTGCASGADSAFRVGCSKPRVYTCRGPEHGIDPSHYDNYWMTEHIIKELLGESRYNNMSSFAKLAHRRNCYQVLGDDLSTPVEFTLLYAKPNKSGDVVLGGTVTAFKLSKCFDIPIFNFYHKDTESEFQRHLDVMALLGEI